MSEPATRPVGRPSKYDPAYCDQVIETLGEGHSLAGFAGKKGMSAHHGAAPSSRHDVRTKTIKPLVDDLVAWMRKQRGTLSSKVEVAKAIDYGLKRLPAFTRFLDDGRICLSNNAAERAMRCVATGRKNWTFAGSDAGGRRAAASLCLPTLVDKPPVGSRAVSAKV